MIVKLIFMVILGVFYTVVITMIDKKYQTWYALFITIIMAVIYYYKREET